MSGSYGKQPFGYSRGRNSNESKFAQYSALHDQLFGNEGHGVYPYPPMRGRGRGRGRGGRGGRQTSTPAKSSKKKLSQAKSTQQKYNDLQKHAVNKGLVNQNGDVRNWAFNVLIDTPGAGLVFGPGLTTASDPPVPENMSNDIVWGIKASVMQAYFALRQEKDVSEMITYKTMVYDFTENGDIKTLTPILVTKVRRYLTAIGKAKAVKAIPRLNQADFMEALNEEVVLSEPEAAPELQPYVWAGSEGSIPHPQCPMPVYGPINRRKRNASEAGIRPGAPPEGPPAEMSKTFQQFWVPTGIVNVNLLIC